MQIKVCAFFSKSLWIRVPCRGRNLSNLHLIRIYLEPQCKDLNIFSNPIALKVTNRYTFAKSLQ